MKIRVAKNNTTLTELHMYDFDNWLGSYRQAKVRNVMANFLEDLVTKIAPTPDAQPWLTEWYSEVLDGVVDHAEGAVESDVPLVLDEWLEEWAAPEDVWAFRDHTSVTGIKDFAVEQTRRGILEGKIDGRGLANLVAKFLNDVEYAAEYLDALRPENEELYGAVYFSDHDRQQLLLAVKKALVDPIKGARKNLTDLADDAVLEYNMEHEASVRVGTKRYKRKTAQSVVYDDRFFRWEGVLFHVYALLRSKTGENLPGRDAGFTKQVKQIPKDIKGDVDAEKLVKAQEAADAGELWYIKVGTKSEGLGWMWSKGGKPNPSGANKVLAIHEVLSFLQRFRDSTKSSGAEAYYIEITNNTQG